MENWRSKFKVPGVILNVALVTVVSTMTAPSSAAQATLEGAAQGQQGQAPRTGRETAALDLTGNWVSVVTEDWLYRMVTPARGDYAGVPLNPEGLRAADNWEPATDGCKPYGVGGLMRVPGRLRISWQDDNTLKIETDAGTQTRLLRFNAPEPTGGPTIQGYSVASWIPAGRPGGRGGPGASQPPAQNGTLKVVTTRMTQGYLRKNGVPYSEKAVLTEYFERLRAPNGDEWFVVTSIIEDPTYLTQPFITSTHFKKEADASKWNPTPCGTPQATR